MKAVYENGELDPFSTCAKYAQVADNGKTYQYKFYSLAAVIAVGYRVNSERATHYLCQCCIIDPYRNIHPTGSHCEYG